jgi:hypothetical protein
MRDLGHELTYTVCCGLNDTFGILNILCLPLV